MTNFLSLPLPPNRCALHVIRKCIRKTSYVFRIHRLLTKWIWYDETDMVTAAVTFRANTESHIFVFGIAIRTHICSCTHFLHQRQEDILRLFYKAYGKCIRVSWMPLTYILSQHFSIVAHTVKCYEHNWSISFFNNKKSIISWDGHRKNSTEQMLAEV